MNRRTFLASSLALGGGGYWAHRVANQHRLGPYLPQVNAQGIWSNWSGHQTCRPAVWFEPKQEDELQTWLTTQKSPVRVVGGGHSFSPLVPTEDALISLRQLSGIVELNPQELWVNAWAGTSLSDLTAQLHTLGYALENQGDINHQSLAGAISTSTHGTGLSLTSLGAMVQNFRLITASGEILSGSEWALPGAVSLGLLGIFTQIQLKIIPTYRLEEKITPTPTRLALEAFPNLIQEHRHAELFVFFHGDTSLVKTLNPTTKPSSPPQTPFLSDDFLLSLGLSLSGQQGQRSKTILEIMGDILSESSRIGHAFEIFPSPREVRFNEMEYQIPLKQGMEALLKIWQLGRKEEWPLFFPMEIRVVAEDFHWLSPFYGQASLSISIHQAANLPFSPYFEKVHGILATYGGRPHWGKLSFYPLAELGSLYPKWPEFVRLKTQLDPQHRFTSPALKPLFT